MSLRRVKSQRTLGEHNSHVWCTKKGMVMLDRLNADPKILFKKKFFTSMRGTLELHTKEGYFFPEL